MKLYLVERYGEDRNGNTTWRHPVGLYKDKGNAAPRCCEDSERMRIKTNCRIIELDTDIKGLRCDTN